MHEDGKLASLMLAADEQTGEHESKRHCSDSKSDVASGAGSLPESKHGSSKTGGTEGKYSAFTAPPRYRNSGAFVHGTKFSNFESIMEQGLKARKSDIFMIDEVRADGRVPGLTRPPEILILIDENKARSENMTFEYDDHQGTWKTNGINGVIRPWFFQKVVDQRPATRGNVLFQSKEDPVMRANVLKFGQRPKKLIHATYWENLYGILNGGIQPGKNPTSSLRQPFRELIQGAENIVHTFNASNANGMRRSSSLPDLGMERRPDAYIVIDADKAEEYGLQLVQSDVREDTVFMTGTVPLELLEKVEANEPAELPDDLKAKIVDPKSFEDIPIIDISGDEAKVIEQLRYACEVVGFMQIRGHGIPQELITRHMKLQKQFFELSAEIKERLRLNDDCPVRGYFGEGGEDLDQVLGEQVDQADGKEVANKSRKDRKEALDTNAVPWSKPNGGYVSKVFGLPSRLPEEAELQGFHEVLEEYAKHMFELARRLLSFMAQVLGLDKDYFEPHLTNPVATHRLLHYWPLRDLQTQIGVGAHTDYGLLTILKQDSTGGLQVLNAKDRKWVHCIPIEDAFVVNLGDMLERWTANRFKSTVHRVVNLSANDRYSVPYFLEPNMDTNIEPGELCLGLVNPDETKQLAWRQIGSNSKADTAENILGRFYRASGQLKAVD